MASKCSEEFWEDLHSLPKYIQALAKAKFELWLNDPKSVSFEKRSKTVWRAEVGDHYRALCEKDGEDWVWFWIDTHEEYNKLKF